MRHRAVSRSVRSLDPTTFAIDEISPSLKVERNTIRRFTSSKRTEHILVSRSCFPRKPMVDPDIVACFAVKRRLNGTIECASTSNPSSAPSSRASSYLHRRGHGSASAAGLGSQCCDPGHHALSAAKRPSVVESSWPDVRNIAASFSQPSKTSLASESLLVVTSLAACFVNPELCAQLSAITIVPDSIDLRRHGNHNVPDFRDLSQLTFDPPLGPPCATSRATPPTRARILAMRPLFHGLPMSLVGLLSYSFVCFFVLVCQFFCFFYYLAISLAFLVNAEHCNNVWVGAYVVPQISPCCHGVN